MGTYTLLSALILLVLPGAVAEVDATVEAVESEPCHVVDVSMDPLDYNVEPRCLPIAYAEESK